MLLYFFVFKYKKDKKGSFKENQQARKIFFIKEKRCFITKKVIKQRL